MFDLWLGDIELTRLAAAVSVVILLPVQLLLCFKVKRLTLRLLPVIALSILTALFVILWISSPGWAGLGYAFLAVFTGMMVLMCGIGWGIWSLAYLLKKRRRKEP